MNFDSVMLTSEDMESSASRHSSSLPRLILLLPNPRGCSMSTTMTSLHDGSGISKSKGKVRLWC